MPENELKNEDRLNELSENRVLMTRRRRALDFIAKLCCLLLAFFLWYYAAGSDSAISEDTFTAIPVEIVNNSAFSVLSGEGVTVNVTLSGTRSALRKVSASKLRAYVDMSHITEAGKYTLDIHYELPNGVTLESSTTSAITVYADHKVSVTVPVKVNVINYILEDGYILQKSDIVTDVEQIVVTGPKAVVETVAHASLTVDIGGGKLTGSVTTRGEIVLMNAKNEEVTHEYISTSTTSVSATVPVIKERQVPITVQYRYGYLNTANCEVTASPAYITVRGEASVVDAISLNYLLDEKTVEDGDTYSYLLDLPASVEVLEEIDRVSLHVALKGLATKTLYLPVVAENDEGKTFDPIAPLAITFRGPAAQIASLKASNVKAVIDLNDLLGTVKVPVSITIDEHLSGDIYEIYPEDEKYTVTVFVYEADAVTGTDAVTDPAATEAE